MRRWGGWLLVSGLLVVGCQDRSVYRSGRDTAARGSLGTGHSTAVTPPGNTATGRALPGASRQGTRPMGTASPRPSR